MEHMCSHDSVEYVQSNGDHLNENLPDPSPDHEEGFTYAGRPPWYDCRGRMKEAYVIGLCGGSASGKTTVAKNLVNRINLPWVVIQSMDSFYRVLSSEQHEAANRMEYDFDHPTAIDHILAADTLKRMKEGKIVRVPVYDFSTHSRVTNKQTVIYGANVIIIEGLMAFHYPEIYDLLDLKIFVDTDSDLRLCRRIKRDIEERGRSLPSILLQYSKFVKPNFDKFIAPQISNADVVVPWSEYNYSAVDMIVKLIKRNLESRGIFSRSDLRRPPDETLRVCSENFYQIKETPVVIALNTIIRDTLTERERFCVAARRLMRICLFETLSKFSDKLYQPSEDGLTQVCKKICVVSIMRAGEAFEDAVKDVLYEYSYGKILIQTNVVTREPEFHHLQLPNDIKNHMILLFDPTISTGAAAIMAIRILIEHEVEEENIIFTSLILTPNGINNVTNTFPKIKLVACAQDKCINENFHIMPGIGNFRERYYGV